MPKVNMLEAKTNLSKLVEAVETGKETEIILARNGKPVARIVPIEHPNRTIGISDSEFGEIDEEWLNNLQAQGKAAQDVLDERWERFERHTHELEEKYGRKRKKSA
jgi:prevent-host-death family protein